MDRAARPAARASRAILVIKLGALGDMMQAFDAFHDIRAHHRGERITLLTTPPFAELAARMPWFDEIWSDGRPRWRGRGRADDGPRALIALIRRLRERRFARVYDLQCNDRTALYFHLLRGRHRPEWVGTVRGATFRPAPPAPGEMQNSQRMRAELAAAGVPEARPTDLSWFDADLAAAGIALPERFVLLVPGCSPAHPEKRWPPAAYAALGERLTARGYGIVLIGTKDDREALAEIGRRLPQAEDLMGRTTLFQLAAVTRRAASVVGNDTGPVFLAALLGAPTLMLMSARTDPARSAPQGPDAAWLKENDLKDLTVERVEAALRLRPGAGAGPERR